VARVAVRFAGAAFLTVLLAVLVAVLAARLAVVAALRVVRLTVVLARRVVLAVRRLVVARLAAAARARSCTCLLSPSRRFKAFSTSACFAVRRT
jgi:hypothetical protein